MNALRDLFLLDPNVIFLNHGSFGACPVPVFETYQRWQLELERQPVEFLGRRADGLIAEACAVLGAYLNADPQDLVFVPNATHGINTVARSLALQPGDEILTTDHEYGALNYTWEFVCRQTGAVYIRHPVPLPVTTHAEFVESFWNAVTPRTRVIFMSHITSPTALTFPVREICRRAREAGIVTIIDGAHVPGQLPLDLTALEPDFYSGNCHKWLCAPKGSAFLYARRDCQELIEPLVISWGYVPGASFVQRHQYQGTRDLSAFLSVPAAIAFQAEHGWDEVRQSSHALVQQTRERAASLMDLQPIAPNSGEWFQQMVTLPMPAWCDVQTLKARLYDEYRIELPFIVWNEQPFIRVSIQGYNTQQDVDALLSALEALLKP